MKPSIDKKTVNITDLISKPKLKSVPSPSHVENNTNFTSKIQHKNKASDESIRKSVSRLDKNNDALLFLYDMGLTQETIDYFKLGLSTPYTNKNNMTQSDALIFPIKSSEGILTTPNANYKIENITQNPTSKYWVMGNARCNFNTARTTDHELLFICDNHKDMWIIHQIIKESDLSKSMLLVTSTDNTHIPNEILINPKFFEGFTKVFWVLRTMT